MFLRFAVDVDMSQQKLDKLELVRREVASTMQGALNQFEEAVRELDKVAPVKRIVEALETPTRRPVPTFGTMKALEAAERFEAGVEPAASEALSTPLPAVLSAEVAAGASSSSEAIEASVDLQAAMSELPTGTQTTNTSRRMHDADEEFAALLMQP